MATAIDTRKDDFSEMDNAGISKEHWKIMFISDMDFFTDAYDLFIIGVCMALINPSGTSTKSKKASSNQPPY
jgi:MFS transporter, PHS family, inorganic phosphate transporter